MSDDLVSPIDAELTKHLVEIVRISVQAGKDAAAQALTEARASAAHWRRAIEIIATIIGLPEPEANFASKVRDAFDELRSQLHDANGVAELAIKHRDAAESELSALRARVREVVGPFGNLAQRYDGTVSDGWIPWTEFITDHEWPSEIDYRAARQFVKEHRK